MNHMCPEQQIEELQFALSKFSHEIRNPFALVSSELQLLLSAHPEAEAFEEWAGIQENLEYIKDLLNELSDYNNAWKVNLQTTDLTGYLHKIAASVRPSMDYLGIHFEEQISSSLPALPVDRIKLRQTLLNLLRNAQEAISGPKGSIVFIARETEDNKIAISVCDNGCGIDPSKQDAIFTPFETYKKGGTGLGLTIARRIVQAHNGTITVKSHPGQGSEFLILLDETI